MNAPAPNLVHPRRKAAGVSTPSPTPRPAAVRHLVWDWNGTLLDDARACMQAINRMIAARGLRRLTLARYREIFRFPVKSYYRELGFDLEREDWDVVAREFHDRYRVASRRAPLRRGARTLLRRLRAAGVPMSILSASEESLLRGMLAARGLDRYFARITGIANLHAASKLDAAHGLAASLGLPPSRVLLVGDTTHDFEVARGLGWRCVLLAGGHQSERRLRDCGCPVLPHLADVGRLLGVGGS